jgi:hypothetical protein
MLISKNGRLIWDEYVDNSQYTDVNLAYKCISPAVSFDDGYSWMSFADNAYSLRKSSTSTTTFKISSSDSNSGFNQLDLNFSFTPYSISEIADITYTADANGPFSGGTTYYFTVMNMTYDLPGYYSDDVDNNGTTDYFLYYTGNYYNGATNGSLSNGIDAGSYYPMSKIKSITLPAGNKYNISLYIKYPKIAKGLCVYSGTMASDTITFTLNHVTNLVQALGNDLAAVTSNGDVLVLENNFPLPKQGTVLVENEIIEYTDCSFKTGISRKTASGSTQTVSRWCLTGLKRNSGVAHKWNPSTGSDLVKVYLAMYDGGSYGEIPAPIYPKIDIDANCTQYIRFDSKNVDDITKNTVPVAIGTAAYDIVSTTLVYSLRLTGQGVVKSNLTSLSNIKYKDTTLTNYYKLLNNKGSLHFYLSLSEFVSTSSTDPYVFCPADNADGLWMKISKFNLKPYFGFRMLVNGEYENIEIASFENYILPSLTKDVFSSICITWEAITKETATKSSNNSNLNLMRFTYIVDGNKILTVDSSISKSKFVVGNLCIGGEAVDTSIATDTSFKGHIDDWRVYANKVLTTTDSIQITHDNNLIATDDCGLITLDNNTYIDYNSSTNNSISESVAISNPEGTYTDASPRVKKYEPKMYSIIKASKDAGRNYGTYYDNWFINAYLTDGKVPIIKISDYSTYSAKNLSYPIYPQTVKIKFDMIGPETGAASPKIKNIMFIASEGTLD